MHPKYRQTCRVCGSSHLTPVIDLGRQFLQGSFVKTGVVPPPTRKLPTELVRCDVTRNENGCGLLQLAHTFPPEILYSNYWYRSGINATMRNHLAGIVESVLEIVGTNRKLAVLDIGCNDGTLLAQYPQNTIRYGVDPSDVANEIGEGVTVVNTVFPSEQARHVLPAGGIDVVTSIAMFYDLEDPVRFASEISGLLRKDGVWVFEMSYLPLMLMQNSFDTICHEHLEYYSLAVLETIVNRAGLKIFKIDINDINGGSIRCYACHAANSALGSRADRELLQTIRTKEFQLELDTDRPYLEFQLRIERLREELAAMLLNLRAEGKRIHVYGASTKGNVLLQWCGIDFRTVDCAADRNPQKTGSKTLGTNIPIVSEETSRAAKPDYYLVLPWHFKKEFLERERDTIANGTQLIFPLPEIMTVSKLNYEEQKSQAATESRHMLDLLLGVTDSCPAH